jgi:hypothetical protein
MQQYQVVVRHLEDQYSREMAVEQSHERHRSRVVSRLKQVAIATDAMSAFELVELCS